MQVILRRLIGPLSLLGLALIIATPLLAGSATYNYDDFGRPIDVLYDDGTYIVYTYDDAGNRLTQVVTVRAPQADFGMSTNDSPDPMVQANNVTSTVTVTNHGPNPTNGSTLRAALSESLGQSPSVAGVTCRSTAADLDDARIA